MANLSHRLRELNASALGKSRLLLSLVLLASFILLLPNKVNANDEMLSDVDITAENTQVGLVANEIPSSSRTVKVIDYLDGLSQSTIMALAQDQQHNLWVGTQNGLNRISGNEVTQYGYGTHGGQTLSGGLINALQVDRNNRLWIASTKGLDEFDLSNNVLAPSSLISTWPEQYSRDIRALLVVGDQVLFATRERLIIANINTHKIDAHIDFAKYGVTLRFPHLVSAAGKVYLGSDEGVYRLNLASTSLTKLNATDGLIIRSMVYGKGKLWLGTRHHGLKALNLTDESSVEQVIEGVNIYRLSLFNDELLIDLHNQFLSLNLSDLQLKKLHLTAFNRNYVSGLNIFSSLQLSSEQYLLGSGTGILALSDSSRYIGRTPQVKEEGFENIDAVQTLELDGGTNTSTTDFLVLDSEAIYRLNIQTQQKQRLYSARPNQTFIRMLQYQGKTYVASQGLGFIELSEQFELLRQSDVAVTIYDMKVIAGKLWLATPDGIYLVDFETLEHDLIASTASRRFFSLNQFGDIVVATSFRDGTWVFSAQGESPKQQYIASKPAMVLESFQASDGQIWLMTAEDGMYRLNTPSRSNSQYSVKPFALNDQFPSRTIVCMAQDKQQRLWMATLDGLIMSVPGSQQLIHFGQMEGLSNSDFNQKACGSIGEQLYFSGYNTIDLVDADNLQVQRAKTIAPQQVQLLSADKQINTVLGKQTQKVAENPIYRFVVTLNTDKLMQNMTYRYRLKGYQSQWLISRSNEFVFTNLPVGDYQLELYAYNDAGDTSEVSRYPLKVTALWYKSYYAYAAYFIISIAIFIWIVLLKLRAARLKYQLKEQEAKQLTQLNEQLEQLVNERTAVLEQKTLDAEQANQDKTAFIATASHDIRHPLNSAKLLLEANQNDEVGQTMFFKRMQDSIGSLSRLIESILDLSKVESAHFKPFVRSFETQNLLNDLIVELSPVAAKYQVNLECSAWHNLNVESDSLLIERVLLNVVINAIEVSKPGLTVSLAAKQLNDMCVVEITDQGAGIPASIKSQLFEPFVTHNKASGTGLGLTIVNKINHVLNLGLAVNSSSKGTKMSFSLPLARQVAHAEPSTNIGEVWVLDDHQESADSLATVLGKWQLEYRIFYDHHSLISALEQTTPDWLLLDFHLQNTDSARVLAENGRLFEPVNIIVMSAEASVRSILPYPFLLKPIKPNKLKRLLLSPKRV
ncbi:hypothetical protein G3R49_04855 [Shewanella sp. WXL01]|uniref:ATP-binding protein n=1 Tax=Shewanella sp. WXL01 TaxID=2709721 RepID=UPI0014382B08|nr:hypothetical protein [Shewanella sp. WXL01]